MKRVTDKYHTLIREDDRHSNQLFDIKEVPKRTYQLGVAALFTGIGLSVCNSFLGLYVSSFLIACFCFAMLIFLVLKYHEAIGNLKFFIIGMLCGLLITEALLTGLQSEQYLYFFPVLVAVPIIVDLKQTQYRESITYISMIIGSFFIYILIGRTVHPIEAFSQDQIAKLAFVNRIVAISSTIVFSVSYIFFEKKYINELMMQSKRIIEARTRFLATMGHELRTPLNGIIGTINLLKQERNLFKQEEYVQILKYCADHMLQQVNNVLDFNKIEADKLEIHPVELNLRQLLLNASTPFTSLFQEKKLELKIDIDPALDVLVMADDLRLIQIFNNLFSNALKFTEKGYIKLQVKCLRKGKNVIEVGFCVEDTGMGIDEDDQKKIFDGFWQVYDEDTRRLTGTGLGLTITVRLLKLMNGDLRLESEKGRGSTFYFNLKFDMVSKKTKFATVDHEEEDNLAGVRILLAEDNPINLMIAKKSLTGLKAMVTTATNGREALDELTKSNPFDIILMDLEMPVMNGYTAIFEIRKLYPEIPVIAFTASLVDVNMLSDLIESGFADCILKPFQPHQLLASIKKYLPEIVG